MIGENECKQTRQTLGQQIAASQVSRVISNRTGVELEYGQLYHLNRKHMWEQMNLDAAAVLTVRGDSAPSDGSVFAAAEKLIASMSNKPDHTYVLLFGEFDDNWLAIRMS